MNRAMVLVVMLLGPTAWASPQPPPWWDAAWPARVRLHAPAGPGDVASVTLPLAGHTTGDGADLRLIDADGEPRRFEILHHDPDLTTTLRFRVEPGASTTSWLYFGHDAAPAIETKNPGVEAGRRRWLAWKLARVERQSAEKRRRELDAQIGALTDRIAELERAVGAGEVSAVEQARGPSLNELKARRNQLREQRQSLKLPEPGPEPDVPDEWSAAAGVLLRTWPRPDADHPEDLETVRRWIHARPPMGVGFRDGIDDGYNPFGPSTRYVSHYTGYLRIDQRGEYGFATVSDDGSWVLLGNAPLVAWPGAHGVGGGIRGEKHGLVDLDPGVVRIDYYHEQGTGDAMAYLAWRPPGGNRFQPIPADRWTPVREAEFGPFQHRDGAPLAIASVDLLDTYWIYDTDDEQASRVRFTSRSDAGGREIVETRWTFGDGLDDSGATVEHVYFRLGRPVASLTVSDATGRSDTVRFRPRIFRVDVVARGEFDYGRDAHFVEAAAGYDVQRLHKPDLQLYTRFWEKLDRPDRQLEAAEAFLRRFGDQPAAAEIALHAADAALQPHHYQPAAAERLLALALGQVKDVEAGALLRLRWATVLGWHLDQLDAAADALQPLEQAGDQHAAPLARQVLIARGDLALLRGDGDEADTLYRQARATDPEPIGEAEQFAKVGSYPYAVEDLLARDEFETAFELIDRWEREMPRQKLEGLSLFLRGKVSFVQHPGRMALRYLELAEQVAPDALHVPEAVWLRANCLMAMDRHADALVELGRIRGDFSTSEYYGRAEEKIAQCRRELEK